MLQNQINQINQNWASIYGPDTSVSKLWFFLKLSLPDHQLPQWKHPHRPESHNWSFQTTVDWLSHCQGCALDYDWTWVRRKYASGDDKSERISYISHCGGRGHLDNSSWVLKSFELLFFQSLNYYPPSMNIGWIEILELKGRNGKCFLLSKQVYQHRPVWDTRLN